MVEKNSAFIPEYSAPSSREVNPAAKSKQPIGKQILRAVSHRQKMSHEFHTFDLPNTHEGTPDVLSVFIPGIAGNIQRHIQPFIPYAREQGDVLLVQPSGERYFQPEISEKTADAIWSRVSRRGYDHIVVNGISMGGNTAFDALTLLENADFFNEQSVRPHSTMFDTPSSREDLVGPAQTLGPIVSRLPFGRLSNMIPAVKLGSPKPKLEDIENPEDYPTVLASYEAFGDVPTSFFFDQLHSIVVREKPSLGSMAFLDSMAYYQSLQGGDIVEAKSSKDAWRTAVNDGSKWKEVQVDTKHVDFEGQPTKSKYGLEQTYDWHLLDK